MSLRLTDQGEDRTMTLDQLAAHLGGRGAARATQRATYWTPNSPLAVYYTALRADGVTLIQSRTSTGVTLVGGLWGFDQALSAVPDDAWIVLWDEGDPASYTPGYEVVDT